MYGSSADRYPSIPVSELWIESGVSNDLSRLIPATTYPADKYLHFSRSGSNTPTSKANLPKRVDNRPLVLVSVSMPRGPRLPYKVLNKKTGKLVWARKPIQVYKLKKGPYPKSKKKNQGKGRDLPPNDLNYSSVKVSYVNPNLAVYSRLEMNYPGQYNPREHYITGALWSNLVPYGSNEAFGPNTQNYTSSGFSQMYIDAVNDMQSGLITKLYAKCKNQSVNLAVALAEYKQTAATFVDLLSRVGRALLQMKRLQLVRAAQILFPRGPKDLANDWLVLQYGIKPLLSDIDGAAKYLAMPEPKTYDIIVRKKVVIPKTYIDSRNPRHYGPVFCKTDVYTEGHVETVIKVRVKIKASFQGIDRDLSRLGFENLNSVAWETIPFSFIADWVIPIGSYLNDTDAFNGLEIVSSHKTVFMKETITYLRTFGGGANPGTVGYSTTAGVTGFQTERVSCVRDKDFTVPPIPFPDFKNPFSTSHLQNALALFVQLKR